MPQTGIADQAPVFEKNSPEKSIVFLDGDCLAIEAMAGADLSRSRGGRLKPAGIMGCRGATGLVRKMRENGKCH